MVTLFDSASRPGVQHVVVLGPQNLCTCEGWQNRQHCKHMAAVIPTVQHCPVCFADVTHQSNVVSCNRCEWGAIND